MAIRPADYVPNLGDPTRDWASLKDSMRGVGDAFLQNREQSLNKLRYEEQVRRNQRDEQLRQAHLNEVMAAREAKEWETRQAKQAEALTAYHAALASDDPQAIAAAHANVMAIGGRVHKQAAREAEVAPPRGGTPGQQAESDAVMEILRPDAAVPTGPTGIEQEVLGKRGAEEREKWEGAGRPGSPEAQRMDAILAGLAGGMGEPAAPPPVGVAPQQAMPTSLESPELERPLRGAQDEEIRVQFAGRRPGDAPLTSSLNVSQLRGKQQGQLESMADALVMQLPPGSRREARERVMKQLESGGWGMFGGPKEGFKAITSTMMGTEQMLSAEARARQIAYGQATRSGAGAMRIEGQELVSQFERTSTKLERYKLIDGYASINQAIEKLKLNPENPAAWNELAFGIARAREGGRLTNQDIERVPGLPETDYISRIEHYATAAFQGGPGSTVRDNVLKMAGIARGKLSDKGLADYMSARRYRDNLAPGGTLENPRAYNRVDAMMDEMWGAAGFEWWPEASGLEDPTVPKTPTRDSPGGSGSGGGANFRVRPVVTGDEPEGALPKPGELGAGKGAPKVPANKILGKWRKRKAK